MEVWNFSNNNAIFRKNMMNLVSLWIYYCQVRRIKKITKRDEILFYSILLVAKCGKAYTIAKKLIFRAAIVLCKRMLSEFAVKLVSLVFLANNNIQSRITDMSANIEATLFIKLS